MEKLDIINNHDDLQVYINTNGKLLFMVASYEHDTDDDDERYECTSIALDVEQAIKLRDKIDEFINLKQTT